METTKKEQIYRQLKGKNFFEFHKKDSLEVLEQAENLEDVIIHIGFACNTDQMHFQYNPKTNRFNRVLIDKEDLETLKSEKHYSLRRSCIKAGCHKHRISFGNFLRLLQEEKFEPLGVYNASELTIIRKI